MPELQRLRVGHAPAVLAFELANRVYFAASVSDRGDEFYDRFTERHSALLAEQEAGIGAFYVLVAGDGSVLGRFNLYRFEDGTAELGYRVAQHVAGRGVATATVRELCGLAAGQYGLLTLKAATSRENAASQKVLARAGFIPVGPADPADLGGKQGTWYQRDLVQPLSSSLLVRGYAVSRSCGLGEVLLPGVAFEVAGVVGIGVVAPLVRMRGLVVPDGELGDLGFEVLTGGEVAAAQEGRSIVVTGAQGDVIAALTLMSNPDRGAQSVFGELLHGFFVLTAWARSWLWSCWSSPCIPAEVRTGLLSAERTAQCAIRDCRTQ